MSLTPLKPPPSVRGPHTNGNGHAGTPPASSGQPAAPVGRLGPRNSIYPLLLDTGLVLGMFGLIILRPIFSELVGDLAIAAGVVLLVVGLVGWIREARADYTQMTE